MLIPSPLSAYSRKIILFCSLFLVGAFQTALADEEFSRLVAFGDSLSDSGNALVLTGGFTSVAPFDPIPSAPYKKGRFSNGKVWIERLAAELGLKKGGKPALKRPGINTNYAVGGARAGGLGPFDLSGQVSLFLSDFGFAAPSDGLYVMWFGGNDIRDGLEAFALDPTGATSVGIITAAVQAEASNIVALYTAGARTFLIVNAPNLAVVPGITGQGPAAVAGALQLSQAYNAGLNAALDGLSLALPGIDIQRFDAFSLLTTIVNNPDEYGFTNAVTPCLTFFVATDAECQKPKKYIFWDVIHPTRKAHKVVAGEVEDFLELVYDIDD